MKRYPIAGCTFVLLICTVGTPVAAQHLPSTAFDHRGNVALAVAVADMNGDGKPDVVTANDASDDVSILLADDACGWRDVSVHPAGDRPSGVAVGDVDGDGFRDVAVSNLFVSTATVLFGNGAGGVTSSQTLSLGTGGGPTDVAIADVTDDGFLDIVTSNTSTDDVSVLAGDGKGGFLPAFTIPAERQPADLDVGDLNGDGAPDIVTMNQDFPGLVSVILTDGAGGFLPTANYSTSSGGWNGYLVQIVDFDVDGNLDVLMSTGTGGGTAWMKGDGAGGFLPAVTFPDVFGPDLVADVTGDGHPEVLSTGSALRVWVNDGAGVFPEEVALQFAADSGNALAVADMNADDVADLIVVGNQAVDVLPGDGTGTFERPPTVMYAFDELDVNVIGGVFADLNGDGHPDLVGEDTSTGVNVFLADGAGSFLDPVAYGVGSNMVLVGDLNHDTFPDIVAGSISSVATLLNDGTGAFSIQPTFSSGYQHDKIDLADVNQDGNLDVLAVDDGFGGDLILILGDGAGGLGPVTIVQPGIFTVAEVGDLNGDPHPDVVAMRSGEAWLLFNDGFTSFPSPVIVPIGETGPGRRILVEDVDGDTDADVIIGHQTGVTVMLGDGTGTFSAPVLYPGQVYWGEVLHLADLDLDGHLDLIANPTAINAVSVRYGDGLGGFSEEHLYNAGHPPYVVGVHDQTGDGLLDLLVAGTFWEESIRLLENVGGPWIECQGGVAGTNGIPSLTATGPLVGDEDITLQLDDALGDATAWLIVGLSTVMVPLKGGVLVPAPDQILGPLPTGPSGSLTITGPVPVGLPPGTELSLQSWMVDALAVKGWAASDAVAGIAP